MFVLVLCEFGTICYVPWDSHRNSAYDPLVEMPFEFICVPVIFATSDVSNRMSLEQKACIWLHMNAYRCIWKLSSSVFIDPDD